MTSGDRLEMVFTEDDWKTHAHIRHMSLRCVWLFSHGNWNVNTELFTGKMFHGFVSWFHGNITTNRRNMRRLALLYTVYYRRLQALGLTWWVRQLHFKQRIHQEMVVWLGSLQTSDRYRFKYSMSFIRHSFSKCMLPTHKFDLFMNNYWVGNKLIFINWSEQSMIRFAAKYVHDW